MPDYKSMYHTLFHAITDSIEILKKAQIEAEELYLSSGEEEDEQARKEIENRPVTE